jgi:hypothetical protein
MFHLRRQKLVPIAQRLLKECLVAATLIAMMVADLPLTSTLPDSAPSPAVPSCCAARLASQRESVRSCGCSSEKRTSGTCCCQGKSSCGKRQKSDEHPALHSCNCSGTESQLLLAGQPRLSGTSSLTSPSTNVLVQALPSIEILGLGMPQPESPPPQLLVSV